MTSHDQYVSSTIVSYSDQCQALASETPVVR